MFLTIHRVQTILHGRRRSADEWYQQIQLDQKHLKIKQNVVTCYSRTPLYGHVKTSRNKANPVSFVPGESPLVSVIVNILIIQFFIITNILKQIYIDNIMERARERYLRTGC